MPHNSKPTKDQAIANSFEAVRHQSIALREEMASLAVGQQVGDVGNSGESGEPHLHIHAQSPAPDAPFSGAAVPIRLQGRFLARNDLVDMTVPPGTTSP